WGLSALSPPSPLVGLRGGGAATNRPSGAIGAEEGTGVRGPSLTPSNPSTTAPAPRALPPSALRPRRHHCAAAAPRAPTPRPRSAAPPAPRSRARSYAPETPAAAAQIRHSARQYSRRPDRRCPPPPAARAPAAAG